LSRGGVTSRGSGNPGLPLPSGFVMIGAKEFADRLANARDGR
jgi:hypothetical protein